MFFGDIIFLINLFLSVTQIQLENEIQDLFKAAMDELAAAELKKVRGTFRNITNKPPADATENKMQMKDFFCPSSQLYFCSLIRTHFLMFR